MGCILREAGEATLDNSDVIRGVVKHIVGEGKVAMPGEQLCGGSEGGSEALRQM